RYIFDTRENDLIFDKLSLVLGQLPVRMTKSSFYERLRNGLSIYKDSTKSALQAFVENIQQIGAVRDIDTTQEFLPLKDYCEHMEQIDFKQMSADQWKVEKKQFEQFVSELEDCANGYVHLQELANLLLVTIQMRDQGAVANEKNQTAFRLMASLRNGEDSETYLVALEGELERLGEKMQRLESALSEEEELLRNGMLLGNSIFVDFETATDDTPVDEVYLAEMIQSCVQAFASVFENGNRFMNKARMACVLSEIPNTFAGQQEVYDYLHYTLSGASVEEQQASVALLRPIMEEI
ncbi:MAG: hypothetical protein ACI4TK_00810, partial [Agathobacter sp.]